MTVTLVATNDVRNYLSTTYTYGAVGTGTNSPVEADTALQTEVVRNLQSSSNTSTDKIFVKEFVINSLQANGSFLTEFGSFDAAAAGDMLSRLATPPFEKNNLIEIIYEFTFEVVNI